MGDHPPTETDQHQPLQRKRKKIEKKDGFIVVVQIIAINLDDGNNLTIFVLEHVSLSKVFHVEDIKYHSRVTNMVLLITEKLQVSKNQFLFELHITSINNITTLLKSVIY